MGKLFIILDNGHGNNTIGKRSPDGRLMEWKWNREFTALLSQRLNELGIANHILVPEDRDIPLAVRVQRANTIASNFKKEGYDVLFISVHVNAAKSDGTWNTASGTTAWVYKNGSGNSKRIGQLYGNAAKALKLTGNRYVPACGYFDCNFYVCKNTNCPAVLVEHMFMDNKDDVDFLLSDTGKKELLKMHELAILNYAK